MAKKKKKKKKDMPQSKSNTPQPSDEYLRSERGHWEKRVCRGSKLQQVRQRDILKVARRRPDHHPSRKTQGPKLPRTTSEPIPE